MANDAVRDLLICISRTQRMWESLQLFRLIIEDSTVKEVSRIVWFALLHNDCVFMNIGQLLFAIGKSQGEVIQLLTHLDVIVSRSVTLLEAKIENGAQVCGVSKSLSVSFRLETHFDFGKFQF